MKNTINIIWVLAALLLLAGCDEVAPGTGPAERQYDQTVEAAAKANEQLRSRVGAGAIAIKEAQKHQPPGPATDATNDEADIILANTGAPSDTDVTAALKRVALTLAGQRDKALAERDSAIAQGKELNGQIQTLGDQIETLRKEKELERQKAAEALAAKDRNWMVRVLTGASVLSFVLFGVALWVSGPIAGARTAWPFILVGGLFLGAARVVGSDWFETLLKVACFGALAAGGLYGFFLWKTGRLEKSMRSALQDAKDEAQVLATKGIDEGKQVWTWLSDHLKYRMPRTKDGAKSLLEKEIDKRNVSEGINR